MSGIENPSANRSAEKPPTRSIPPLDAGLYALNENQTAFFKELTGIKDDEELKNHIIGIQHKAYEVFAYPCIRRFTFTTLKIARSPGFAAAQKLRATRPDAILLDVGCCFGNDLRKAVLDGWPVENVIGSDLRPALWNYGHELFKSTPESFPAAFIAGDVFDSSFLYPNPVSYENPRSPRPDFLEDITSLTELQGHCSAIFAAAFFHLFDEPQQFQLAQRLASLVSPLPGSIIFGSHIARPDTGARAELLKSISSRLFCHSPKTWAEMWDGGVFKKGTVRVQAGLKEVERRDSSTMPGKKIHIMYWSVTRV
ncbi:hypothetical protein BDN72DRAFT_800730 [Pluteus cervinus]|uniref:Uncharacterized protein n=1 Tax=Pluteus cervinus TaxID=181527 RepID=A0ACD3AJ21_9AGAR|nr:hypothetical protein BDN72DRAFT_800730 [Pluteus cervinus]